MAPVLVLGFVGVEVGESLNVQDVPRLLNIQGFLMNHTRKRDYANLFRTDDGRLMSPDEAKNELLNELAKGRKVIPTCECDNFDYQRGCLGHEENNADSGDLSGVPG